jgi:hypothetical protein
MSMCMYVWVSICLCMWALKCLMHLFISKKQVPTYAFKHTCMHMHIHTYIHTHLIECMCHQHIHTSLNVCVRMYAHLCMVLIAPKRRDEETFTHMLACCMRMSWWLDPIFAHLPAENRYWIVWRDSARFSTLCRTNTRSFMKCLCTIRSYIRFDRYRCL